MKYIEEFKEELIRQDKSQNTISGYERDLKDFKIFFQEKAGKEFYPEEIIALDIQEYRSYLLNIKKQDAGTINHKLTAMGQYFKFLVAENIMRENPAAAVKKIKVLAPTLPGSLDKNIVYRLRREFHREGNKRDICIFELIYNTGVRVSELVNIDLDDFDITDRKGELDIRAGKGMRARILPLNKDARNAILNYLHVRPKSSWNKLLLGERGPLQRQAINKIIKKYKDRAGLGEYKIAPHTFRHQFAYDLLDSGEDIVTAAELLGHSDINVTRRYSLPTKQDKQDAVEKLVLSR